MDLNKDDLFLDAIHNKLTEEDLVDLLKTSFTNKWDYLTRFLGSKKPISLLTKEEFESSLLDLMQVTPSADSSLEHYNVMISRLPNDLEPVNIDKLFNILTIIETHQQDVPSAGFSGLHWGGGNLIEKGIYKILQQKNISSECQRKTIALVLQTLSETRFEDIGSSTGASDYAPALITTIYPKIFEYLKVDKELIKQYQKYLRNIKYANNVQEYERMYTGEVFSVFENKNISVENSLHLATIIMNTALNFNSKLGGLKRLYYDNYREKIDSVSGRRYFLAFVGYLLFFNDIIDGKWAFDNLVNNSYIKELLTKNNANFLLMDYSRERTVQFIVKFIHREYGDIFKEFKQKTTSSNSTKYLDMTLP